MNTRGKGIITERLAEQQLRAQGFLTYRVKGSSRFQKNQDIFGLFDILAVKPTEIKFIQVKGYKVYKSFYIPFKAFKEDYGNNFSVEVWIKYNRKKEFEVVVI